MLVENGIERKKTVDQLLKEKLQKWNVKTVVWDLDDTLVGTYNVFFNAIYDACGILTSPHWQCYSGQNSQEDVARTEQTKQDIFDKTIWGLRRQYGINPVISRLSLLLTAKQLGISTNDPKVDKALQRIGKLYTHDIPVVFDHVHDTLDTFNASGNRLVLATHAEEAWTWHKIISCGLTGKFERIICLSVYRHKSYQWENAFKIHDMDPHTSLVIGDNFNADIVPTAILGAKTIWITNGRNITFSGEKTEHSEIPVGVPTVKVEFTHQILPSLVNS